MARHGEAAAAGDGWVHAEMLSMREMYGGEKAVVVQTRTAEGDVAAADRKIRTITNMARAVKAIEALNAPSRPARENEPEDDFDDGEDDPERTAELRADVLRGIAAQPDAIRAGDVDEAASYGLGTGGGEEGLAGSRYPPEAAGTRLADLGDAGRPGGGQDLRGRALAA